VCAGKASQYPTSFTSLDSRSKREREPPFPYGQFSGVFVGLMWKSMRASSSLRRVIRRGRTLQKGTRTDDHGTRGGLDV
jgi:hypothetical protein